MSREPTFFLLQSVRCILDKYAFLADDLTWGIYENLDQLRSKMVQVLPGFCKEAIASLAGWGYILEALYVAGIC